MAEATREMDMRNVESPGCHGQATHAPAGSEIRTAETLRPEQYGPLTQKLGIPAASRCRHRLARNQTGQKRKQHLSARHAWPYSRGLHAVTGSPGGKKQREKMFFRTQPFTHRICLIQSQAPNDQCSSSGAVAGDMPAGSALRSDPRPELLGCVLAALALGLSTNKRHPYPLQEAICKTRE